MVGGGGGGGGEDKLVHTQFIKPYTLLPRQFFYLYIRTPTS